MRIFFIRHGDPNYKDDCLTDIGRLQAAAMAERMKDEGVTEIISSSCGRAYETAKHLADKLSLPITQYDELREIAWGAKDSEDTLPRHGHPWLVAADMIAENETVRIDDWQNAEPYSRSLVVESSKRVADCLDTIFEAHGFKREGEYYRITGDDTSKTVAIFSHGGVSAAAFSHLFNIPFPQSCAMFHIDHTAISLVDIGNDPATSKHDPKMQVPLSRGTLVMPRIHYIGEYQHIKGLTTGRPAEY